MEILSLNNYNYLRGGSEKVFFGEMDLLKAHGHDVVAFARNTSRDIPATYSHLFPKDIKTDSTKLSFKSLSTLFEVVYSKTSREALQKLLKKINPDVAHAHNIYGRLTTSVLDSLHEKKCPVVMTLHDYKLICPSYKLMSGGRVCEDCKGGKYYHAIVNKCHKDSYIASAIYSFESWFNAFLNKYKDNVCYFIAPSQFLRNKLIEFGWSAEQIVYIPNYIVSQDFIPNYGAKNYLLYIGRLSGEKGIGTLIQAFKTVKEENVELLIVGDGPERESLVEIAKADNRIQFTGYLSGEKLAEVTQNAKAVVVPSEWYENAPISILEAFAYGKPVIGARIGGIPEMIDEGKNGLLYESGNVDELAEKINELLGSSNEYLVDLGKAARKKVEENYNPEMHFEKLINVYQKAINMKARI